MLQTEGQVQQSMSAANQQSSITDNQTGKTVTPVKNINVDISLSEILLLYAASISIALLLAITPIVSF
jgi:hypothetical protein